MKFWILSHTSAIKCNSKYISLHQHKATVYLCYQIAIEWYCLHYIHEKYRYNYVKYPEIKKQASDINNYFPLIQV